MTDAPETLHPRANERLTGHDAAAGRIADAWESGRMAHAWLLTGPWGIGKATLAYRATKFVLSGGGASLLGDTDPLAIDPGHPAIAQILSGAHPNLHIVSTEISSGSGREIVVDDVRRTAQFLRATAADGGWRVIIVDAVDDLNRNAANALLKLIEEPPRKCLFFLVNHAMGTVLPTIRSRCRVLRMQPLEPAALRRVVEGRADALPEADLALLGEMAQGSPGRAMMLLGEGGLELRRRLAALLEQGRRVDRAKLLAFADELARPDATANFRLAGEILGQWLVERAKRHAATGGPREAGPWWDVWEACGRLFRLAESRSLDRKQVVMDAVLRIESAGARVSSG